MSQLEDKSWPRVHIAEQTLTFERTTQSIATGKTKEKPVQKDEKVTIFRDENSSMLIEMITGTEGIVI